MLVAVVGGRRQRVDNWRWGGLRGGRQRGNFLGEKITGIRYN